VLVVDQYHYLPGSCTLCRSSNLPTVDTNVDLDWQNTPEDPNPSANRRLYICADCCINLAQMVKESRGIEVKPAQNYALLENLNQQLSQKNTLAMNRIAELEQALATMRTLSAPTVTVDPQIDVTPFTVVPDPDKPKPKK